MSSLAEYHIPSTDELFSQLENMAWTNVKQPQNYNPIYEELFDLTPSNANTIQLNQKFMLQKLVAKENDSIYNAVVHNNRNNETKKVPVFFKYSPLLDPIKLKKDLKQSILVRRKQINIHKSRFESKHRTQFSESCM